MSRIIYTVVDPTAHAQIVVSCGWDRHTRGFFFDVEDAEDAALGMPPLLELGFIPRLPTLKALEEALLSKGRHFHQLLTPAARERLALHKAHDIGSQIVNLDPITLEV